MEWGDKIYTGQRRPAWLKDDATPVFWHDSGWQSGSSTAGRMVWEQTGDPLEYIQLEASHTAYTAINAGYEPNPGDSEKPPADYDGGPVLARNGSQFVYGAYLNWKIPHMNDGPTSGDIIGYKCKAGVVEDAWSPVGYVSVKRVSKAEALASTPYSEAIGGGVETVDHYVDGWIAAYRHLGLIREPTRAETIAATTGVPLADVEKVLAEIVS